MEEMLENKLISIILPDPDVLSNFLIITTHQSPPSLPFEIGAANKDLKTKKTCWS